MKKIVFLVALIPTLLSAQFDFYGPKPFHKILDQKFTANWTPTALSNIVNRKYVVILDQATKSNVLSLSTTNIEAIENTSLTAINGVNATYKSLMNSVFQIVDKNTHFENDSKGGSGVYTPLSGLYKISPSVHSYYNLNSTANFEVNSTNGGSIYVKESNNTGYLIIQFTGNSTSTKIKATEKWVYNSTSKVFEEVTSWEDRYLFLENGKFSWILNSASATNFFLADASLFFNIEVGIGSDFNPLSISYQPNATAEIPSTVLTMEESKIITALPNSIAAVLKNQLGNSANAAIEAAKVLDLIETTLKNKGESLRYPKAFYLQLRENMLSHIIQSSDVFNARLGKNAVEHVYFTNESDANGNPHPFMVIASHATSARPNFLLDVSRPPGAQAGKGYGESTVTRNAKLGEFLIKIPLKDYGLISSLLENNLSAYGDLASDFDKSSGTTTVKDVYNYTGTASIGVAVDGVSIYPAKNNNLRFAAEDAEITSSGIHVGGGLELHYHSDGHGFNGNGINLYNLTDYSGKNHPPVIGISYDGIALFGKYENAFSTMSGYGIALDEFGGHDHGDGFGYHYHAHKKFVTSTTSPFPKFNQHMLLVGAWKGKINNIPGFLQVKDNQLKSNDIGPYAGSKSSIVLGLNDLKATSDIRLFPNPTNAVLKIDIAEKADVFIYNREGKLMLQESFGAGISSIYLNGFSSGMYVVTIMNKNRMVTKTIILNRD